MSHRRLGNFFKLITLLLVFAALPVSVYLVQNVTSYLLRARGEPANLVIDLSKTQATSSGVWRNFAQGGESSDGMLGGIVEFMSELDADYIRLDHIYDFYQVVSRGADGKLLFNWDRLDREVDAILAANAKPFLSLSYFPPILSVNSTDIDSPDYWQDWQALVKATIEHYSGRSKKGIRGMYYEVWNEPDLFGGFKTYGNKNYLTLYGYSARAALSSEDVYAFKFGGPAITAAYPNWFNNLLKFTSENDYPIDFLSWHRYSYNPNDYANDINLARKAISQFPEYQNLELIISELGPNSENDPAYDSLVGAIHSLSVMSLLDQNVTRAFSFELQDGKGPEKYWGRWGMLTHNDFVPVERKPRFEAYLFLNSLFGRHVAVSGQGSWVKSMARFDGQTLRIMISNFDKEGNRFEAVPVRVLGLANGNWNYKRRDFLGETIEKKIVIKNGEYSTLELFYPNTAAILELERIN